MKMDYRPRVRMVAMVLALFVAAPPQPTQAGEQCDFDQATRHAENLALQKKYPGSTYNRKDWSVRIPVKGGTVTINKGGCVHYGMSIELATKKQDAFAGEQGLFQQVVALARDYAGEMQDADQLKKLLRERKWSKLREGYYFIQSGEYEVFEVYRKHDGAHTIVGISFYN